MSGFCDNPIRFRLTVLRTIRPDETNHLESRALNLPREMLNNKTSSVKILCSSVWHTDLIHCESFEECSAGELINAGLTRGTASSTDENSCAVDQDRD